MKKVVFTIASLFMLMLVGCSGSGSAGSATSDASDVSTSSDTAVDDGTRSSGAYIPAVLPDIPSLPE